MTEWIEHNSPKPPALAPAAIIKAWVYTACGTAFSVRKRTVGETPWKRSKGYRRLRDPDGVPYCSAEGLEPWAEYVVTDPNSYCTQMDVAPHFHPEFQMYSTPGTWRTAPDTHRHPGDWRESLMRVWKKD